MLPKRHPFTSDKVTTNTERARYFDTQCIVNRLTRCVTACDFCSPAPTWLVKEMRGLLSPFITLLFNKSLISGCFPAAFKQALVRPLLKKPGLDAGDRKSFRPVSQVHYVNKINFVQNFGRLANLYIFGKVRI